jgi:hypothetical protein
MRVDDNKLDFAYKYPFSQEARDVVAGLKLGSVEQQYLKEGVSRLEGAFKEGKVPHDRLRGLSEVKQKRILSYVYARMLVSAIGDTYSISKFAAAEANAAIDFLPFDTEEIWLKISNELKLEIKKEGGYFVIGFEKFVSVPRRDDSLKLVNQRLDAGIVRMDSMQLLKFLGYAIEKEIASRLPIDRKDLPKEVIEAAKGLKPQEQRIALDIKSGVYGWIEKLMLSPIADVRHRTVNLILAPYLVNVKKLDEESAVRLIVEYIDRCKKVNPDTKVNETYIRYQCKYAKTKGLRPMSLSRARELLNGVADFG